MLFIDFSNSLSVLETTNSRTEITVKLAEIFNKLEYAELAQTIYLLQGRIAPEYIPLELNFSNKSFLTALDNLAVEKQIEFNPKLEYSKLGDSGRVAELLSIKLANQDSNFKLADIFTSITSLANQNGKGAVGKKQEIVKILISSFSPVEARYFGKIVTGHLRLGFSQKTLLDAISWAKLGTKALRPRLDRALGVRSDIGLLASEVLFKDNSPESIKLEIGIPLAAQLVEREKSALAIIKRMSTCVVQAKYDGLRAQLHFSKTGFETGSSLGEKVRIFSRNMEPLTDMFPDLTSSLEKIGLDSLIIDGEIIGYDESTDSFLPFQETSQRRRKYNVDDSVTNIPINYYVFDLLYLNGQDLTTTTLEKRLDLLAEISKNFPSQIKLTLSPIYTDGKELEAYFRKLLDEGLEGIIAKDPNSYYQPGKRGYDWIKLKANTFSDLKDTVDGVIMGYYFGRGQRAKFGIGGFLVGVYNKETDTYQTIAKVGSGVKELEWEVFKDQLTTYQVNKLPLNYLINKDLWPDVLVEPKIVIEIDADEITLSKNHTAVVKDSQLDKSGLGYSLRFPRLKTWGRDKLPEDTTTPLELQTLYNLGKSKLE